VQWSSLLVVIAGSGLGGGLRYLVSVWCASRGWDTFPWATLIVNVAGCFLIMLIATIAAALTMNTNLRLFLTTGIMGGLTTYSTFDYETTKFLQAGEGWTATANVGLTVVVCFVAGLLGIGVARLVLPAD
jgi:fluoride exporter